MKALALLLLLIAAPALAQTGTTQPSPAPPTGPTPPPGLDVAYACPGGPDFSAHFTSDGDLATLRMPGEPDIELPRQNTNTGFLYTDGYYELRGRAREATLTAAGRSIRCHAAGRPGEPPRTFTGPNSTLTLFPDGTFRLREKRDGVAEPVLDLGQWAQEVDGGVRLVIRGGDNLRHAYREIGNGKLIDDKGVELTLANTPDLIDGKFQLRGLYRDAQDGGLFTECFTGRTYGVTPGGAEPDLERAWTQATPSREASLYVEVIGKFVDRSGVEVEEFLSLKPNGACPPLPTRGAALRNTEWRLVEIDGERVTFDDWRRRPTLRLDDEGRFSSSSGCNSLGGTYELTPDGLRFVAGPMTLMACPPPAQAMERRFIDALGAVRSAQIVSTVLDLSDDTGKRRLRFEARSR